MPKNSFEDGLEAAARFLERTAADYDQMSERLQKDSQQDNTMFLGVRIKMITDAKHYASTAELLCGQAKHVRLLRRDSLHGY